jgi:tetratricopeptide (TPR) repeat protein
MLEVSDRVAEACALTRPALELARRAGDRTWEAELLSGEVSLLIALGHWTEAVERVAELTRPDDLSSPNLTALEGLSLVEVHVYRGDLDAANQMIEQAARFVESTDDLQYRSLYAHFLSLVLRLKGELAEALAAAEVAVESGNTIGAGSDVTRAEEFLGAIERRAPGESSPFLRAQGLRFRARLSAKEDQVKIAEMLTGAAAIFRELGMPFWLAVTLLEHAEWLTGQERAEEATTLLAEAREIFERLEARPFLERIAGLLNRETISA